MRTRSPVAHLTGPSAKRPSRIFGPCRSARTATLRPAAVGGLPDLVEAAAVLGVRAVAEVEPGDVHPRLDERAAPLGRVGRRAQACRRSSRAGSLSQRRGYRPETASTYSVGSAHRCPARCAAMWSRAALSRWRDQRRRELGVPQRTRDPSRRLRRDRGRFASSRRDLDRSTRGAWPVGAPDCSRTRHNPPQPGGRRCAARSAG